MSAGCFPEPSSVSDAAMVSLSCVSAMASKLNGLLKARRREPEEVSRISIRPPPELDVPKATTHDPSFEKKPFLIPGALQRLAGVAPLITLGTWETIEIAISITARSFIACSLQHSSQYKVEH